MKKNNKLKSFLKFVTIMVFVIICIGIGAYNYFYAYLQGFSAKTAKNKTDNVAPITVKGNESVNILVMGTDIGTVGASIENNRQRTDTMMIVHYNPKDKKMNIISVPRDTMVKIDGKTAKINSANEKGGANLAVSTVEDLLNIKINYFAKIDYNGFDRLIDAIGGVDMEITNQMDYDDPGQDLHIHFNKGTTVHLDGKKAEEFFRWRKNNEGVKGGIPTGDIGRIDNQHIFISKIVDKVKSFSIVTKLPSIMDVVADYVATNMSADDIINYIKTFATLGNGNISMATLQGSTPMVDGVSYFVYEPDKNEEIVKVLHDGETNTSTYSLNKATLKIKVLNCTGKAGLAKNFQQYIEKSQYSNIETGDGEKLTLSKVSLYGLDEKYNSIIKKDFEIDNIENLPKSESDYDIIINLGNDSDFKNIN